MTRTCPAALILAFHSPFSTSEWSLEDFHWFLSHSGVKAFPWRPTAVRRKFKAGSLADLLSGRPPHHWLWPSHAALTLSLKHSGPVPTPGPLHSLGHAHPGTLLGHLSSGLARHLFRKAFNHGLPASHCVPVFDFINSVTLTRICHYLANVFFYNLLSFSPN